MKFSFGKYRHPLTLSLSALILIGSGACLGVGLSPVTEELVTVSGPSIAIDSIADPGKEESLPVPNGKININTATVSELDLLPEIGRKRAQYIIDYRNQSGPFETIEEIKSVKDIGSKRFEKLKDLITVE